DDGSRLESRLAVAADGAGSALRRLVGLQVDAHDYGQRGVVAYIRTEHPHQATAWQRFLPTGPLALLPFTDGLASIVWSLPDAEAARVLELDEERFAIELGDASAGRLGRVELASKRAAFPLRRQLVRQQVAGRVLVLGDAAHVVHPLAGQGVNLGLRDVAALQEEVAGALRRGADWAAPHRLQRWERRRLSDNTVSARAFETINTVFSNAHPVPTLLRGHLLGLAGRLPPLKRALWRHAAGLCARPYASADPAGQFLAVQAAIAVAVDRAELALQGRVGRGLATVDEAIAVGVHGLEIDAVFADHAVRLERADHDAFVVAALQDGHAALALHGRGNRFRRRRRQGQGRGLGERAAAGDGQQQRGGECVDAAHAWLLFRVAGARN